MREKLKNTDESALSFVTSGLSPLQETAFWPVSASEDWSDLLLQELQTPAYINFNKFIALQKFLNSLM